jgi:hypothetical protein
LNDALRAKVKADLPLPEPIEVLRRIAQDRSWGKRDELSLTQVTIDQFVHIFKTLPATPELGDIVRSALLFKNMQGASADLSRVSANAEQALRIIAGESELNRLRIQRFGIPLEQNEARAADQNSG